MKSIISIIVLLFCVTTGKAQEQFGVWQYESREEIVTHMGTLLSLQLASRDDSFSAMALDSYLWSWYKLECLKDSSWVYVRVHADPATGLETYHALDYSWEDDSQFRAGWKPGADYMMEFKEIRAKYYPMRPTLEGYMQWKLAKALNGRIVNPKAFR